MMKRRKEIFKRDTILQKLMEIGEMTAEGLIKSVFKIPIIFDKRRKVYASAEKFPSIDWRARVAFHNLLYRLKKDELISRTTAGKIKITDDGIKHLDENPSWTRRYEPAPNTKKDRVILVMFDIPEVFNRKRDWLRFHLREMGFLPIQKSVFYSNNLLPEDFVQDLKKHKILHYIHVLSVNKAGTLSRWLE